MATGNLGEESINSFKKVAETIKNEVEKELKNLSGAMVEVDNAARDLSKEFGLGSELIQAMKVGLTDAAVEVAKLGGSFSDIVNIQKDVANVLNRNVILSSDLYDKLFAANKVTGQGADKIVQSFRDVGASSFQAVEGMQKVVDVARSQGVNAQKVSAEVLNNMGAMNKFTFQGGVEGLAKMASQAVGLRINMTETLDLAEELLQPERAIEMAASLQRLGVAQTDLLDPLRLMDLAQNDPAELQNQIVKMTESFVQLNEKGQFEIMPHAKRQLMEISKEMGISYNELTKMAIGSADLDKKMREIDFGSRLNLTDDQKKMIANMAEMGEGGTYKIQTEKGEKSITELDEKDLEYLAKASEPKTLEELQKEQLKIDEEMLAAIKTMAYGPKYAVASMKTATQVIETGKSGAAGLAKGLSPKEFSPKSIREISDESISKTMEAFGKLSSGENSLTEFFTSMGEIENKITTLFNNAGVSIVESLDKSITEAAKSSNPFEKATGLFYEYVKKMFDQEMKGGSSLPSQSTTQTIPAQDFIIKTLPEDEIRVVGGTKLGGGTTGEQKLTGSVDVNLNINLNSNNTSVSANDIINAMRSGEVQQQLISSITDTINNGMKGNINPQLNPYSANPLLSV